jgi:serine/threonine protein kinase
MDIVDEIRGRLQPLDGLGLSPVDEQLVTSLLAPWSDREILYLPINGGLSGAIKIFAKPRSLFPFIVKIGDAHVIEREHIGDKVIRLRVPPLNIPPLVGYDCRNGRAAIMYRYITGGRVRDRVDRLDQYLSRVSDERGTSIVRELFDTVLRKCHWMDGDFKMRPVRMKPLDDPEPGIAKTEWSQVNAAYELLRRDAEQHQAPHAIIHGDLHPKNVLVTRDGAPVLIDFAFVGQGACVFRDFGKFEVGLQFELDESLRDRFRKVALRVHSGEPLILPRTDGGIGLLIHTVRSILWRDCLSRTVGMTADTIDTVYRAYLAYSLARVFSRASNSHEARRAAYEHIMGLAAGRIGA